MKHYINISQFNFNVIYVRFDKMGFGFVYRRQNGKGNRFKFLKIKFNSKYNDYSIKVVNNFKEVFDNWELEKN